MCYDPQMHAAGEYFGSLMVQPLDLHIRRVQLLAMELGIDCMKVFLSQHRYSLLHVITDKWCIHMQAPYSTLVPAASIFDPTGQNGDFTFASKYDLNSHPCLSRKAAWRTMSLVVYRLYKLDNGFDS